MLSNYNSQVYFYLKKNKPDFNSLIKTVLICSELVLLVADIAISRITLSSSY